MLVGKFGKDVQLPENQATCLCDNQDLNQAIVVGNHCIKKWGIRPTMRGKGLKVECDICGSMVNTSGLARHQQRPKCQRVALSKHDV